MNIRGVADRTGVVQGYRHAEGDISFEVTRKAMVYFMYAGRFTPAKSGSTPNFVYAFTPAHVAKTSTAASGPTARRSLSILIQRSANPQAYVGVNVGQYAFTLEDGLLVCTASVVGFTEAAQSAGTPSFTADGAYGPGQVSLEIPTGSARSDIDTLSLTHNDNLTPRFNLTGSGIPAYNVWGEREITASFEVDFDTLADYTVFRNQTIQTLSLKAIISASNDEFDAVMGAQTFESFETGLGSIGDVNRAAVAMHAFYNTADSIVYTVKSNIDIT